MEKKILISIGILALLVLVGVIVWIATGERKSIKKKFAISAGFLAVLIMIGMPALAAVSLPYRPVEYSYSGVRWVDEEPDECVTFQLTLSGERSLRYGFRGTLTLSVEGEEAVVMENYTIVPTSVGIGDESIFPNTDTFFFLYEPDCYSRADIVASVFVKDSSWKEIFFSFHTRDEDGNGGYNTFDEFYSAPAATREEAVALTNEILGAMAEFEGVVWE